MWITFTILFRLTSTPNIIPVKRMLHLSCTMLKEQKILNSSQPWAISWVCVCFSVVSGPTGFVNYSTCKKCVGTCLLIWSNCGLRQVSEIHSPLFHRLFISRWRTLDVWQGACDCGPIKDNGVPIKKGAIKSQAEFWGLSWAGRRQAVKDLVGMLKGSLWEESTSCLSLTCPGLSAEEYKKGLILQ